jgi:hypothetical protein
MAELSHIYTALSRVMEGRCLRVWPAANLFGDLDRLRKFQFSPSIIALDYAYDDQGIFKAERYIQKWNEINNASAQPNPPAAMMMTRPPPQVITVENHSRWYVPFLRLAFELEIESKPEWGLAINEIQAHWNNTERPFQTDVDNLVEAYRIFIPNYDFLKDYIANLPAGYIPQEFQEFMLNDFRLWDTVQSRQKLNSLSSHYVREAFFQLHELLSEEESRIDHFNNTLNLITIDLQSAIGLHIHSLNIAANAAYESDLAALRLANHEAREHYNAIHNPSHGRGRGRSGGGTAGRGGPRSSSTGGRTVGESAGRGRGRGRGGRGAGGRGRGRSREGGQQIVSGVNAHTITTRGGGGRGNAVLSGRL